VLSESALGAPVGGVVELFEKEMRGRAKWGRFGEVRCEAEGDGDVVSRCSSVGTRRREVRK
jgi:hypothetical protein